MRKLNLDFSDIQGNILRAYGFPFGRFIFLNVTSAIAGQKFIRTILPMVTTAEIWQDKKPDSTLNIALSRTALTALDLPEPTVRSFPPEFLQGMAARASSLGDNGDSAPENWDAVWHGRVDLLISLHALTDEAREEAFSAIKSAASESADVQILDTQDSNRLQINGEYTAKEHFGYTDGISQPLFKHSHSRNTAGDGKVGKHGNWDELETGDFLIGYPNEAIEIEAYPEPIVFSRNGSYLVYRKLQQDVQAFQQYVEEWGVKYPGGEEKLKAKFLGRWPDGTPVSLSPDEPNPTLAKDPDRNNDFVYRDDPEGEKCPLGAHIRRANPRDSLMFHGNLSARRRIIRRGMPYGSMLPSNHSEGELDDADRGFVFQALNANISRQFEFIQQQWINYGNDLHQGEDADPVIGNQGKNGKFVIPGDSGNKEEPFICSSLKSFVTLKGGDYFFIPSLTALNFIAEGSVDSR